MSYLVLWSILYKEQTVVTSFFSMWLSNFPIPIYWRVFLFSIVCFWLFCQKLFVHIHVVLFLSSQFFLKNFFKNFYSVKIVCIFSPSLHPTPANPTSLPHLHPPPWFCPCVLYSIWALNSSPLVCVPPSMWIALNCILLWVIWTLQLCWFFQSMNR